MNMKQKLVGAAFLMFGAGSIFSACGLEAGGESCTFDEDCSEGFVCHENVCSATCETQEECGLGETCVGRTGGAEGMVCALPAEDECSADTDCAEGQTCEAGSCVTPASGDCTTNEECGEGNICMEGACVEAPQGPTYQVVQILDESEGDSCSSFSQNSMKGDPGSDILYAYLADSTGGIKGWAELVDFSEGTSGDKGNGFNDLSALFDGNAPDYIGSAECPAAFRDGKHVSLGCGGYLLVKFLGADGTPVALAAGDQVKVAEWGSPSCGSSDTLDSYSVNLCTNTTEALTMNAASCNVALGFYNGGINSSEVTLP